MEFWNKGLDNSSIWPQIGHLYGEESKPIPKTRVAIGIRLDQPWAHHFDVFTGIERYALVPGNWDWVVEPFLQLVRQAHGRANYDGVIAGPPRNSPLRRPCWACRWSTWSTGRWPRSCPACCPIIGPAGGWRPNTCCSAGTGSSPFKGHRGTGIKQCLGRFQGRIRADDVARHVHATGLTLRRHFRAAPGRTVIEEITRLRWSAPNACWWTATKRSSK